MTTRRNSKSPPPRFAGLDGIAVAHRGRRAQRAYLVALARLLAADIAREEKLAPESAPPPDEEATEPQLPETGEVA